VSQSPGRPIIFLSDYGLQDEFVGICHGVIARIAPHTMVIDLSHSISPHDVLRGALLLADSLRFMPAPAVYLAIVDPGVGTDRPSLAVEARSGDVFVGPDNGLLWLAVERAGGVANAAEITSRSVILEPVSATFHGRDVFAPAAAHLSTGMALGELGSAFDAARMTRLTLAEPWVVRGRVEGEVLGLDRFGNVELNVRRAHLAEAGLQRMDELQVRTPSGPILVRRAYTFGEIEEGEYAIIEDSRGWLAVVCNGTSAAKALHLEPGDGIVVQVPGG
jgi:S-adenosylmethionine hydrolase